MQVFAKKNNELQADPHIPLPFKEVIAGRAQGETAGQGTQSQNEKERLVSLPTSSRRSFKNRWHVCSVLQARGRRVVGF
jgi:hypothetical protein